MRHSETLERFWEEAPGLARRQTCHNLAAPVVATHQTEPRLFLTEWVKKRRLRS
jgi:hypothetical protein